MGVVTNKRSVMTLFSEALNPYAHQVRIVLAEKGVTVDIINSESDAKREELLELNHYGSVPTLVDRDLVLYQANIIMEYLDERFPHPPLLPVYPVARGRSRLMMHRVEKDWYTYMHQILEGKGDLDKARSELRDSLASADAIFEAVPYFMSEDFSLVDCCIAPLLWRLPQLEVEIPKSAKNLADYAKRIFERESFQESLTQDERNLRQSEAA